MTQAVLPFRTSTETTGEPRPRRAAARADRPSTAVPRRVRRPERVRLITLLQAAALGGPQPLVTPAGHQVWAGSSR